jgi:hypothetical protein
LRHSAGSVRITLRMRRGRLSIRIAYDARSILVGSVNLGGRGVGEETADVAPRYYLYQVTALNVSDLDKCRLERQDERIVHG